MTISSRLFQTSPLSEAGQHERNSVASTNTYEDGHFWAVPRVPSELKGINHDRNFR